MSNSLVSPRKNILVSNLWLTSAVLALAVLGLWWLADLSAKDFALTMAAACVSIVGALVITESLLRPVYTADVVRLARISERMASLGVSDVQEETTVDLDAIYGDCSSICIASSNLSSLFERHWPSIRRATVKRKLHVQVFLPAEVTASSDGEALLKRIEQEWKASAAATNGGSLRLEASAESPPRLLVLTDRVCGLAVNGSAATDPVMVLATRSQDPLLFSSAEQTIALLLGDGDQPAPFFSGGKVPS